MDRAAQGAKDELFEAIDLREARNTVSRLFNLLCLYLEIFSLHLCLWVVHTFDFIL